MGRGDNRKSPKMKQKTGQRKKQDRIKKRKQGTKNKKKRS